MLFGAKEIARLILLAKKAGESEFWWRSLVGQMPAPRNIGGRNPIDILEYALDRLNADTAAFVEQAGSFQHGLADTVERRLEAELKDVTEAMSEARKTADAFLSDH